MQQAKTSDVRTLGEQSQSRSFKIVKKLYAAGAVHVQVVDLARVAGVGETANTLWC